MKNLYWIEDEIKLIEIIECLYHEEFEKEGYRVKFFTNWDQFDPSPGDIVIYDLHGVGKKKVVQNVIYFVSTGDPFYDPEDKYYIQKPFTSEIVETVVANIKAKLNEEKEAK